MPTVWGYCRASTAKQELTLIAQSESIRKFYEYKFKDKGYSFELVEDAATSASVWFPKRPGGAKIYRAVQPGDAVVVTKLDRAFRNMRDMSSTMEDLKEMGVALHLLDINVSTDSDIGRLMSGIMSSVADFEKSRIITRTKEALAVKRQKLIDAFEGMEPFNTKEQISFRNTPYGWGWDKKENKAFKMPEDIEVGKIVLEIYMRCLAKVKSRAYQNLGMRKKQRSIDQKEQLAIQKKELVRQKVAELKAQYPEMSSLERINLGRMIAYREIRSWEKPKQPDMKVGVGSNSSRNKAVRFKDRMDKAVRDTMAELHERGVKMPDKVKKHRSFPLSNNDHEFVEKYGYWRIMTIKSYVRSELKRTAKLINTEVVNARDSRKETPKLERDDTNRTCILSDHEKVQRNEALD